MNWIRKQFKKRAVKAITGGTATGLLIDTLGRLGLPEGVATEMGDGIAALVAWLLG